MIYNEHFMPNNFPIKKMLEMANIKENPTDIKDYSVGTKNNVYKITFSQNKNIILRIRTFYDKEYGQEPIAERIVYPLLDKNFNAPKLYFYCMDEKVTGYKFAIFEYIDGPTLDKVILDKAIDISTKKQIMENLGKMLAIIHKIKGNGFGDLISKTNRIKEGKEYWTLLLNNELIKFKQYNEEIATKFQNLIPFWVDKIDSLPKYLKEPRLIHGDVHGQNIIVKDYNKPFLIDWETSRFRTAPYDFGRLFYLNLKQFPIGIKFLIDSYCSAVQEEINRQQFDFAIKFFEFFWHIRMCFLLYNFPSKNEKYFGTANKHIMLVKQFINQAHKEL